MTWLTSQGGREIIGRSASCKMGNANLLNEFAPARDAAPISLLITIRPSSPSIGFRNCPRTCRRSRVHVLNASRVGARASSRECKRNRICAIVSYIVDVIVLVHVRLYIRIHIHTCTPREKERLEWNKST